MNEKIYTVTLSVPLGTRDGKLCLQEDNGKVTGWLEVMNHRNPLSGTLSQDGTILLEGKIKTLINSIDYTASGTLCENKISLNVKAGKDVYSAVGEEVSQA